MKILVACEESGTVREAFRALGHNAWSCDFLPTRIPGQHYQCDVREVLGYGWDMMIAFPDCTYLTIAAEWAYVDVPMINGKVKNIKPGTLIGSERRQARKEALDFVRLLLNADIPKIALENPVGVISKHIRKFDQKIQPWQFGHDASKGTCLWLKNLPVLNHTNIINPAGWSLVRYAHDNIACPDCGEPYCEIHNMHYWECPCIGPTQDDATYKKIDGYEFATLDSHPKKPVWGNQTPSGQNNLGPSKNRARDRSVTYKGIAQSMAQQWGELSNYTCSGQQEQLPLM
jgi:hypothetical protein